MGFLIGIAFAFGGLFSVYYFFRWNRNRKFGDNPSNMRRRNGSSYKSVFEDVFPNIDSSSKNSRNYNRIYGNSKLLRDSLGKMDGWSVASVLGESAWIGTNLISNFFSVNENFYHALSNLSGQQLSSIGDLHKTIDSWDQNWYGGFTDGAINKLQGHLAESIVKTHLENLGHHVELATNSNQVGYDMIIDGHPLFNPKFRPMKQ